MNFSEPILVELAYYAMIREKTGRPTETIETSAKTALELYAEIKKRYGIILSKDSLRVSVNNVFSSWQTKLKTGDHVAFIPPVSGG